MKIVNNPIIEREGYKRYIRAIEDDPVYNEQDKLRRKFEFLREIVNDGLFSGILTCGPVGFDKFNMFFDMSKNCWIIKLEAEVFEK